MPRAYRLKFLDSEEHVIRDLDIQADDEETAIKYGCRQSVRSNMTTELCCDDMSMLRVTPMSAMLYLPEYADWRAAA